jgi:hypothetical protein
MSLEDETVSQEQRVMAEIGLIRAALAQQGDRLQKLPRQAVWLVHRSNGKDYRLTYQPTPINAWMLFPTDREAADLQGLIEETLRPLPNQCRSNAKEKPTSFQVGLSHYPQTLQPVVSSGVQELEEPTAYNQQLHLWCIIQHLPEMQRRVVGRFRRRNDADAHMKALRPLSPAFRYAVIFDPTPSEVGTAIGVAQ